VTAASIPLFCKPFSRAGFVDHGLNYHAVLAGYRDEIRQLQS
jgi:hypothetical protein